MPTKCLIGHLVKITHYHSEKNFNHSSIPSKNLTNEYSKPVGSNFVVSRPQTTKNSWGSGGAVSPPASPGQSPGGSSGRGQSPRKPAENFAF